MFSEMAHQMPEILIVSDSQRVDTWQDFRFTGRISKPRDSIYKVPFYRPSFQKQKLLFYLWWGHITQNNFNYIFGIAIKLSFYWCAIRLHISHFEIWPHRCHITKLMNKFWARINFLTVGYNYNLWNLICHLQELSMQLT